MNTLIVNRETFQMPDDGWYQLAPLGEFAHAAAGVVQVVGEDSVVGCWGGSGQGRTIPLPVAGVG
jgi:hypothetical protein